MVNKVAEGRPHCVDRIKSDEVALVINTTLGTHSIMDSKSIREAALRRRVPYVTTIAGARAWAEAIAAMQATTFDLPPSLQELHRSASSPAES